MNCDDQNSTVARVLPSAGPQLKAAQIADFSVEERGTGATPPVGQIYIPQRILETRRPKAPYRVKRKETRNLVRHYRYHRDWKVSGMPLPNRFLTIRFDRGELAEAEGQGKTVARHASETALRILRSFMREAGHPWLAQWVIEAKSCPHVHIAFWMPGDVDLEIRLCRVLAGFYGMSIPEETHPIAYLDRKETRSREPVCFRQVTPTQSWIGTKRCGLEGLIDYLAKTICKNATRQQRRNAWDLGKIVGRSNAISARWDG